MDKKIQEGKEIQGLIEVVFKTLEKWGFKAGLMSLEKDDLVVVDTFGNRKDTVHIIYSIIENLKEEDKLILLSMILGIKLGDE